MRGGDDEGYTGEDDSDSYAHDEVVDGHGDDDGPDRDIFELSNSSIRVPNSLFSKTRPGLASESDTPLYKTQAYLLNKIQSQNKDQSPHNTNR